ncbi:hypothetical protein ABZ865_30275 [Streptomyces sp. NPDC047085]|uniref:hypothetical protein n=1 Tax=Streptomyces sp. NPDC047085 TaxID=3155140 RepID=UPI0033FD5F19
MPTLVWDERYGWRIAISKRHPIGKEIGTPPEGDGIRYLSEHQQPDPPRAQSFQAGRGRKRQR